MTKPSYSLGSRFAYIPPCNLDGREWTADGMIKNLQVMNVLIYVVVDNIFSFSDAMLFLRIIFLGHLAYFTELRNV